MTISITIVFCGRGCRIFLCFYAAFPPPLFEWYKNGILLHTTHRYQYNKQNGQFIFEVCARLSVGAVVNDIAVDSRENNQCATTSSFEVVWSCQLFVYLTNIWEFRQVPFPTARQVNVPACSPPCPFNGERQVGKL